jgi:hypothetical protein
MGKNAKYNDFNEYYYEVYSRLSKRAKNPNTAEELKEILTEFYYKDIADTTAVLLVDLIYSTYKKYLR